MSDKRFGVSYAPHIRQGRTVRSMILTTLLALAPAALWGLYQFGSRALFLIEIAVGAAVVTELLINKFTGKAPLSSLRDFHAVLVGCMLAMLVPVGAPWWLVAIGAVMAILVGKAVFGPVGGAPISPVLVGLLIVAASWPTEINRYQHPTTAPEAYHADCAAAPESPLAAVGIDPSDIDDYNIGDLFVGHQPGAIGTVSPVLLLLGGLFLIWRRVARWQAPLGFLLGLGISAAIAHASNPEIYPSASFHLFTGTAMFGAFFLATDWSSTPVTPIGMFIFGLLAGGLSLLFRLSGMAYGPVPWAIVVISLTTPLLDRIAQKPFGKVSSHA